MQAESLTVKQGKHRFCLLAQLLMTTWPLLKASNFPKRSKTAKEWRKSLKVVKRDDCDSFHAGISHKICHHIHNFSDFFVNWNIQVTLVKQWLSLITGRCSFAVLPRACAAKTWRNVAALGCVTTILKENSRRQQCDVTYKWLKHT